MDENIQNELPKKEPKTKPQTSLIFGVLSASMLCANAALDDPSLLPSIGMVVLGIPAIATGIMALRGARSKQSWMAYVGIILGLFFGLGGLGIFMLSLRLFM